MKKQRVIPCAALLAVSMSLPAQEAAQEYIGLYKRFLSDLKNGECAMYPSCSAYGAAAFRTRPFPVALAMLTDRLTRCSHDADYYSHTYARGFRSLVDYPDSAQTPTDLHGLPEPPKVESLKRRAGRDTTAPWVAHLINKELYAPALTEIERAIYNGTSSDTLLRYKLVCYGGLRLYEQGVYEYETAYTDRQKRSLPLATQAAKLYVRLGSHKLALETYMRAAATDTVSLNTAALLMAESGQDDRAAATFASVGNTESAKILSDLKLARRKRPGLACALGIVPGLGYLYAGHSGSALTAFVMNGLFAYATYTSFRNNNYGVGALCAFLGVSFYIGNITGGGKSARRRNQTMRDKAIDELKTINRRYSL